MKLTAIAVTGAALASAALVVAQGKDRPGPGMSSAAAPSAAATSPVVLELFTSQGCSSCPPADKLVRKLAAEPGIVAISRPVTYWDRLGWKDSLARPANTDLQRGYAARGLVGQSGVYTPQIVIDGRSGEVGSDEAAVRRRIAAASRTAKPRIASIHTADGGLAIDIGAQKGGAGELVLVSLDRQADVRIGSGENGGRLITYTNVVVAERKLADWSGAAQRVAVPASALKVSGADRYAVLLRAPKAGPVLAGRIVG